MEQARGRFTVQIKNPDGIGWLEVAARDSWESAEAFAACRERMTGIEHRACLSRQMMAEGDATQERA